MDARHAKCTLVTRNAHDTVIVAGISEASKSDGLNHPYLCPRGSLGHVGSRTFLRVSLALPLIFSFSSNLNSEKTYQGGNENDEKQEVTLL